MDFFSRQKRVERISRSFFFAFIICVVLTVLILWAIITFFIISPAAMALGANPLTVESWWFRLITFLLVAPAIMIAIMTISSRYTWAIREGGGVFVAESLGAVELLKPESRAEKQLINVIEEMAVAAVLPRPRIYIMRDQFCINAFTAGLTPEQTVVVATQGLVEKLNREEMQAVAAHELAHILNGDSSLALRIGGWLYGLEYLTILAEDMFEGVSGVQGGGRFRGLGGAGGILFRVWFAAFLLYAAGLTGKIMGKILESLFSQQREFLADSFAAQFTRNPQALAGALKKIGSVMRGSAVRGGGAAAFSSYFFACPSRRMLIFDTHPPLADRIRALEPEWDGVFPHGRLEDFFRPLKLSAEELREEKLKLEDGLRDFLTNGEEEALSSSPRGLKNLVEYAGGLNYWGGALVGSLLSVKSRGSGLSLEKCCATENDWHLLAEAKSLASARYFLSRLPLHLREAAVDIEQIPALTAAVLIDEEEELKQNQLGLTAQLLGDEAADAAAMFRAEMNGEQRLPLLNLAAPGLRSLDPEAKTRLVSAIKALIAADRKLDLFEMAAGLILEKYLDLNIISPEDAPAPPATYDPQAFKTEVTVVLAVLAYIGAGGEGEDPKLPFIEAMACFSQWPPESLPPRKEVGGKALVTALKRLEKAPDELKRTLMLAAVTAALHDRQLTVRENEMLAALAAALDVPSPFLKLYALDAEAQEVRPLEATA